jgi:hypothetical protein
MFIPQKSRVSRWARSAQAVPKGKGANGGPSADVTPSLPWEPHIKQSHSLLLSHLSVHSLFLLQHRHSSCLLQLLAVSLVVHCNSVSCTHSEYPPCLCGSVRGTGMSCLSLPSAESSPLYGPGSVRAWKLFHVSGRACSYHRQSERRVVV